MRLKPVIIDAQAILERPVTIGPEQITVDRVDVSPGRGWLRRLAPEGWAAELHDAGIEAVSRSAAVSALASIARDDRFAWLTALDHLGGAENKPFQYQRASASGVPVPEWIVTTDDVDVPRAGSWIAKPLGPGSFVDDRGNGRVVPTKIADLEAPGTIAKVPFVLQRLVPARNHARVVTVGPDAWSATLPADGLPIDWRTSASAHFGFTSVPAPDRVHELALAVAGSTNVGYSAQDWIEDTSGNWWFIDLNPAGQWLFLPKCVSSAVTAAIARHLDGD